MRTDVEFRDAITASSGDTAAAVSGCDIDHVCVPLSVKSLKNGFGYVKYSANEARRLARVDDIAKLAAAAGRPRHAPGSSPWVVVATSPVFVFAYLAEKRSSGSGAAAAGGGLQRVVGDVPDARGAFLAALSAISGNTFLVHATNR